MLASLAIRDVVLVDHLQLDFRTGLSVLTGETGAGKSILLDALGLALGTRADARLVRHGADQAVVSAAFQVGDDHEVRSLLEAQGMSCRDDTVVLRRVLGADGRSRAFVNDHAVGIGLLRRLGETLVEIHGQFESQRLLDPSSHRGLLDLFGGLTAEVAACADAWRAWRAAAVALAEAEAEVQAARRDEEFLRQALAEVETLDPKPGEEDDLAARRTMLQDAEKLTDGLDEAARALSGPAGRGVDDALRGALRAVQRIAAKARGRLDPVVAALERAVDETLEAQAALEKAAVDLQGDPRSLERTEERLFALRAAARKHSCAVADLPALRDAMAERLATLDDGAATVARLAAAERAAAADYRRTADLLSDARRRAAERLDAAVAIELEPLRLGKARFRTTLATLEEGDCSDHGRDRVAFEVATNPGAAPGPINRIASGGELARFMLALKVVLARADPVSTLIFDEVDAGVGGAVAAAVGQRLARLADDVQVLVVTHSPQVAARADHHWRVSKDVAGERTRTSVDELDDRARTEEIARMLAGASVTDAARAAAVSLLQGAAS
jgi:DNA repair protein RecN (Recombination protein N)